MTPEKIQTKKGIWVRKENPLYYETSLRETQRDVIAFIPFEHKYEPMYLGSVGFFNLNDYPLSFSRHNLTKGLLQNKFYPLGGLVHETRPDLLGKGLAKKIEFEIAKELLKHFPEDTLIAIGASSDSHLEYCKRIGIVPFKAMPLKEYVELLG